MNSKIWYWNIHWESRVKETWTYWVVQRLDGISYGEGQGVIMTKDGSDVATATGRTEGRMTDSGE
ncbi:MAG: hypothetical protein GEU26_07475 [Nitrososphaeraceae archaeon]|nr:hypothetical protein [Nitrososphaeraceae archaeon]